MSQTVTELSGLVKITDYLLKANLGAILLEYFLIKWLLWTSFYLLDMFKLHILLTLID